MIILLFFVIVLYDAIRMSDFSVDGMMTGELRYGKNVNIVIPVNRGTIVSSASTG